MPRYLCGGLSMPHLTGCPNSQACFWCFCRFGVAASCDWVHVACSWYPDIAPARALGIKWVWLDREGTREDAGAASAHVRCALKVCETVRSLYEANA